MNKLLALPLSISLLLSTSACVQAEKTQPSEEKEENIAASPGEKGNRPKNVIVMVGDGMGIGQLEVARLFEYGKEGQLFIETLPNVALAHTYSANNMVTDSAAAATALATGVKTKNEMIGVKPNGREVDSISDLFKESGKKVGVVSTNTVTDATPAGFTASVKNRWTGQGKIARQQLENNVDVLLGGGLKYFQPKEQRGNNLIKEYEEKGYTFVSNSSELETAKGSKLLGLFNSSYMNFKQDRDEVKSQEPSLKLMTKKAIEFLSQENKGFFLMVEGARIDHASHAADIPGIWKETIEFDEAVKHTVNWAKSQKDTLVLVLADHETMGISATEAMKIEDLKKIKVSPTFMASKLTKIEETGLFTKESIKKVFKTYANINLSDQQAKSFNERISNRNGAVYGSHRVSWEIGSFIADYYDAGVVDSSVRSLSSTGGHTANMAPVFSYGVGSESFTGVMNNVDIPRKIAKLMDYKLN